VVGAQWLDGLSLFAKATEELLYYVGTSAAKFAMGVEEMEAGRGGAIRWSLDFRASRGIYC